MAIPFFSLMFAIFEIGGLLLLDAVVETAVADASRMVRTGRAQQQGMTAETLKASMCQKMSVFSGDCATRAFIDVRIAKGLNDPEVPDPVASGVIDPSKIGYQPGQAGDRILVRVWYEYPVITPFLQPALQHTTDGKMLLVTSLAFRNEPYS